jgi:hypothetical protein
MYAGTHHNDKEHNNEINVPDGMCEQIGGFLAKNSLTA